MTSVKADSASPGLSNYAEQPKKSAASAIATALSLGTLNFASHNLKPVKLTLTPHHLFYLLSRFEELAVPIGPMNIRLESLHAEASPANYVSFLSQSQRSKGRGDRDSLHSVSSVRSAISSMSSLWSSIGIGSSANNAKSDKAKAQLITDTKYLYSAFTKIPCLRLSPDRRARMIRGYEEFPFDTAVPLIAFKNLGSLEICDVDFRQFYGWDRLADQLRSLTIKRANIEDPNDLLVSIVLDDMDKRRRRSSKTSSSPMLTWPSSPYLRFHEIARVNSAPVSSVTDDKTGHSISPKKSMLANPGLEGVDPQGDHNRRIGTNNRSHGSRPDHSLRYGKHSPGKCKRSGSGSSNSSDTSMAENYRRSGSSSNLISMGILPILPASKWRFLRHLSLADNSLTSMSNSSLAPLANTLHSLDLSSNLFADIPDCLAVMTALQSLNMANCMIENLHSLARNPLPAITALNLRANRLASIAGIERLLPLERLDLRDNRLHDPMEIARLTGIPEIREIWVLHNPFVKTHGDYRMTMFNLFRSTPGYLEDIVIDSSGPTYSERRQLRDRIAESDPVPVIKPLPPVPVSTDLPPRPNSSSGLTVAFRDDTRPVLSASQSEFAVSSSRRRRGPRRRIVDLAKEQPSPILHQESGPYGEERSSLDREASHPEPVAQASVRIDDPPSHQATIPALHRSQVEIPTAERTTTASPVEQAPGDIGPMIKPRRKSVEMNLDAEAYRHKVEALKQEVGSNWLSVLNEQGWHDRDQNEHSNHLFAPFPTPQPEAHPFRAPAPEILTSGRTLG